MIDLIFGMLILRKAAITFDKPAINLKKNSAWGLLQFSDLNLP